MAGRGPGYKNLPRPVRKPDSLRDPERFQPALVPPPEGCGNIDQKGLAGPGALFPVARDKTLDFGNPALIDKVAVVGLALGNFTGNRSEHNFFDFYQI